jgi:deoxyribodipyrimidine photo-lyase
MISAMFLTKLLLQSWQKGEQEFAYWLADYDLAANNGGWQWSSSTGTDAVPYFRIFSPWSQTERFDPDGEYIKRYIPQLGGLSGQDLSCAVKLTKASQTKYPKIIKDYHQARQECLEAFKNHD